MSTTITVILVDFYAVLSTGTFLPNADAPIFLYFALVVITHIPLFFLFGMAIIDTFLCSIGDILIRILIFIESFTQIGAGAAKIDSISVLPLLHERIGMQLSFEIVVAADIELFLHLLDFRYGDPPMVLTLKLELHPEVPLPQMHPN
jgi:hypothetical protein